MILTNKKVFGLLVMVIGASAIIILINYFTLRITSSVRAYINGESQYSKGQKDAVRDIILYLETSDTVYWNRFGENLKIPIGDSIARTELMKEGSLALINQGFLQGKNKKEDLDEMIWLFRHFNKISFMSEAIAIWKAGDHRIGEAWQLGLEIHQKIQEGVLTPQERSHFIERININAIELTKLEASFSEKLGDTARKINLLLFYTNLFMILIIIGSASAYASLMIRRLRNSNQELAAINKELDRFVYSASHDLRAPISSMKGLVHLTERETDLTSVKSNLEMMMISLERQDQFIDQIIDFSRNKKIEIRSERVDLVKMIDQSIRYHQHMPEAGSIDIEKDLELATAQCDPIRLEIIINNLLSNAIKYSDKAKEKKQIKIHTLKNANHLVMEITDNGIGIEKEHLHRIFEMFFVTENKTKGSGLGLYIVKETVNKLNGTIRVESKRKLGTKFTVILPNE